MLLAALQQQRQQSAVYSDHECQSIFILLYERQPQIHLLMKTSLYLTLFRKNYLKHLKVLSFRTPQTNFRAKTSFIIK